MCVKPIGALVALSKAFLDTQGYKEVGFVWLSFRKKIIALEPHQFQ